MTADRPMDADDSMIGPAPWTPPPTEAAPPARPREKASTAAGRRGGVGLPVLLLVLVVGLLGGLIGAASLAPLLPAPIAAWLSPAQPGVDEGRIAAIEAEMNRVVASLTDTTARVARDNAALQEELAGLRDTVGAVVTRLETAESRPAAADGEAAEGAAADSAALRAEIDALRAALEDMAGAPDDGSPTVAALADRIAALENAVESGTVARSAGATLEPARAAQVAAALEEIADAMASGEHFDRALHELEVAGEVTAPSALREAAAEGVATRETLLEGFTPAAHDAVTEHLAEDGSEGVQSVLARVQARFTGIPDEPQEGETVPAILSRVRHALLRGRLSAALDEIESLPPEAATAMGDWIHTARLRRDADAALDNLRAALEARY